MKQESPVIIFDLTGECQIASLPEWGKYAQTYGESYDEALENAKEVLEDLVSAYEEMGKPSGGDKHLKTIAPQ
ncbi:type II toxin-antitoxin system HicB family antitoxin [Okeania sp. SIO1F9]|uniref:type II toxin-antitoxin system HicB family antitoxin n=1 Tax=Okeania sp. SIO1F9 TaxID=2607813 RepID=UPI00257C3D24|nr:type II toxin-antitoxin system HicB family antitoxin [Okeania sp. SIO1F9]